MVEEVALMISPVMTAENIGKKMIPVFSNYPVKKAILFGSYANGTPTSVSDLDLYIDTNGQLKGLDFVGLLEQLVNLLDIEIDLFDSSHLESDSEILREIEKKGIVIYEKSEDNSKND
jgi:predicted nucleotidyltransferase